MESFFRYIAYVDYYEKGLRLSNAGYLRWKMAGSRHQLEIEIREAKAGTGYYRVIEEETGAELAVLQLVNGQGSLKESYTSLEKGGRLFLLLSKEEWDLYRFKAFRIELEKDKILRIPLELPLPEQKENRIEAPVAVQPLWKEKEGEKKGNKREKKRDDQQETRTNKLRDIGRETIEEGTLRSRERETAGDRVQQNPGAEAAIIQEKRNPGEKTGVEQIPGSTEREMTAKQIRGNTEMEAAQEEEKVHLPLEEDKWQQLCRSYPQVHPFPGGRTFLSIRPEDFVLLQENYQKLVHNSFLLHGYYNYRHMILGKLEDGEEQPYYIGVPGVFYEKEKQAAGLFGFAGFEGTEYPVRNGSQGYYMIEVKL